MQTGFVLTAAIPGISCWVNWDGDATSSHWDALFLYLCITKEKWWEISQSLTMCTYTLSLFCIIYKRNLETIFTRDCNTAHFSKVFSFISRRVNKFLRRYKQPLLIAACRKFFPRDLLMYTLCITCFTISSNELIMIETFCRLKREICLELLFSPI
jgi:hypothetical protein